MSTSTRDSERAAKLSTVGDREIRIERYFDAPRDKVWRAFSEPDLVAQWWGRGNRLVIERMEFERGGHWRFLEHADDGVHGFEGRYREIRPKDLISYTFEWDGMPGYPVIETTVFEDLGERTKVTTTARFFEAAEREGMLQTGMEGGLNQSYAALDALLERLN